MLVRTQIMMPEDVYESLRLEAALRETSMSKLVVKAISTNIIKTKKKIEGVEALNKLVTKAYKGKGVPIDLGSNDSYLYGKS